MSDRWSHAIAFHSNVIGPGHKTMARTITGLNTSDLTFWALLAEILEGFINVMSITNPA